MIRSLRQMLPPTWVILLFGVCYALSAAFEFLPWLLEASQDVEWPHTRAIVLVPASIAYGIYRVFAFHPATHPRYHQWLTTTPWRSRLPLPKGPVHPVWQDGAVLVTLAILGWKSLHATPAWLLMSVSIGYMLSLCVVFASTGLYRYAYAILFGFGLAVRLVPAEIPLGTLLALLGIYGVGLLGLHRSLAAYPWEFDNVGEKSTSPLWSLSFSLKEQQERQEQRARRRTGHPYECLEVKSALPAIPTEHGVYLSLLAGWSAYVIYSAVPPFDRKDFFSLILVAALFGGPLVRIGIYCARHRPPINLLGRLVTLRWIIPGYDRVFVAPLLAMMVGVALLEGMFSLDIGPEIRLPVVVTAVSMILLIARPTLGEWHMTGSSRMTLPMQDKTLIKV